MRLAQLARKLSLKPVEIQTFLSERGYSTELNPNSRLTDDQVLVVVRKFDPSMETSIFQEQSPAETPEVLIEPVATQPVVSESQPPALQPIPEAEPIMQVSQEGPGAEPEVIRAPKAELPGLRVVGKIELKEPKKKEASEDTPAEPETAEQRPQRPVRPVRQPRQEQSQRQWRNPLEAQREREAREREEKRERQIELDKQRRTQKYLKKVKSVPTKAVKRIADEATEVMEDTRPEPKSWLGKLARWLTT